MLTTTNRVQRVDNISADDPLASQDPSEEEEQVLDVRLPSHWSSLSWLLVWFEKPIFVPTCERWEPCRGAWEARLRADQGSAWELPQRRQGTRLRPPPTTWWCSSSPLLRASSLKIEQSYWWWKTTTSLVDSSVLTTNACWNVAAFLLAMTMCVKNVFCSEWIWSNNQLNWNQLLPKKDHFESWFKVVWPAWPVGVPHSKWRW